MSGAYRDSSGGDTGAGTATSINVTLPASTVSGDWIFAMVVNRGPTGNTITAPTGWTAVGAQLSETNATGGIWKAKYGTDITGAGPWNFTFASATATKAAFAAIAVSGTSGVPDASNGQIHSTPTSTTHASPSITTSVGTLIIAFGTDRIGTAPASSAEWTWPAGWTERTDSIPTSGTNVESQTSGTKDSPPTASGTYSVSLTAGASSAEAMVWIIALPDGASSQNVSPALIDQTGATFSPTFTLGNVNVSPALINSAGSVFAPSIKQTVTMALIDRTGSVFAPTFALGAVSVTPALIDRTGAVFAPVIAQVTSPSFINQAGVVFAPTSITVAQSVTMDLIDRTGTVFNPTFAMGNVNVSPALITQTGTVFTPSITIDVNLHPALIDQTGVVFAPWIRNVLNPPVQDHHFWEEPAETEVVTKGVVPNVRRGKDRYGTRR